MPEAKPFLPDGLHESLRGAPFFPVHGQAAGRKWKKPAVKSWKEFQSRLPSDSEISSWAHHVKRGCAWAMVTGAISGTFVLDFDGPEGLELFNSKFADALPPSARTPRGGRHAFFAFDKRCIGLGIGTKALGCVDWRGNGGFIVAPGSENGREWLVAPVDGQPLPPVPEWFFDAYNESSRGKTDKPKLHPFAKLEDGLYRCRRLREIVDRAERENHLDHEERRALGNYAVQFSKGEGWFWSILKQLSDYDEATSAAQIGSLNRKPPRCDGGGLCGGGEKCAEILATGGASPIKFVFSRRSLGTVQTNESSPSRLFEELLGDIENGARFVRQWGKDVRYCPPRKLWYVWDGKRWAADEGGEILRRAKLTARGIFDEAMAQTDSDRRDKLLKHATSTDRDHRLRAMLSMAGAELSVMPADFDQNRLLLNVQNGTLDLAWGGLNPHTRADLCSKISPISYQPGAQCPRFLQFLNETFLTPTGAPDREFIAWFQRAVGYSLTGEVKEQCFFIGHGVGRNGKSTLMAVLLGIMGDYAGVLPAASLLSDKRPQGGDVARGDIAGLVGKRLVVATEPPEGAFLDEPLVKWITGEPRISARFQHGHLFEFNLETKIWLTTNYKPRVSGTDEGIWRRVRLLPFLARITPEMEDPELGEKLEAEREGILAWAVEGARLWFQHGIPSRSLPACVQGATSSYRKAEDVFGEFWEDAMMECAHGKFRVSDAWEAWKKFCEQIGRHPGSLRAFSNHLDRYTPPTHKGTGGVRERRGYVLRPPLHVVQRDSVGEEFV